MQYKANYMSPVGGITLGSDGEALTGLWFDGQKYFGDTLREMQRENSGNIPGNIQEEEIPVFIKTKQWLDIYFSGKAPDFIPDLRMICSDFRKRVWEIMLTIPYGQTMTYKEIASVIGQERKKMVSAQAVGGAVGHNSISLIIPCHRVVGTDGNLTGYAGGIDKKIWLLRHEGADTGRLFAPGYHAALR